VAQSPKAKLLPRARALYAAGSDDGVIAASLNVSETTIRRWAREDEQAGEPWLRDGGPDGPTRRPSDRTHPRPRTRTRAGTDALCRQLQDRLERLIQRSEEDLDDAKIEERMLKVCRVLESLRGEAADLDAQLELTKRFAAFCMRNLSEQEMDPVRKAIRLFVDNLREEHS
jgi:transposase